MATNPYQPPGDFPQAQVDRPAPRWPAVVATGLAWLAVSFPLLTILACYLAWLTAWWVLGEQPVPMQDDPKDIDTPAAPLFFAAILMLILCPLGLLAGIIASAWLTAQARTGPLPRWLLLPGHVMVCVLTVFFLRWDPLRVAEWLID